MRAQLQGSLMQLNTAESNVEVGLPPIETDRNAAGAQFQVDDLERLASEQGQVKEESKLGHHDNL